MKLLTIALMAAGLTYAGNRTCDFSEGPPCTMKSCTQIDKRGRKTGMKCVRGFCKKGCCHCGPDKCNPEYPGTPSPDDESLEAGLQSGRVD